MKKLLIGMLLIAKLGMAQNTLTDHEEFVHFTAHFGASFAINTLFYGIFSRGFKCERGDALIMAATLTTMTGIIYKLNEANATQGDIGKAVVQNGIGILTQSALTLMFQF